MDRERIDKAVRDVWRGAHALRGDAAQETWLRFARAMDELVELIEHMARSLGLSPQSGEGQDPEHGGE